MTWGLTVACGKFAGMMVPTMVLCITLTGWLWIRFCDYCITGMLL